MNLSSKKKIPTKMKRMGKTMMMTRTTMMDPTMMKKTIPTV